MSAPLVWIVEFVTVAVPPPRTVFSPFVPLKSPVEWKPVCGSTSPVVVIVTFETDREDPVPFRSTPVAPWPEVEMLVPVTVTLVPAPWSMIPRAWSPEVVTDPPETVVTPPLFVSHAVGVGTGGADRRIRQRHRSAAYIVLVGSVVGSLGTYGRCSNPDRARCRNGYVGGVDDSAGSVDEEPSRSVAGRLIVGPADVQRSPACDACGVSAFAGGRYGSAGEGGRSTAGGGDAHRLYAGRRDGGVRQLENAAVIVKAGAS